MDSYDVFDTVIGRICYKGTNIFKIIETLFDISGFETIRISHEKSTLDDTYKSMESVIPSSINLNIIKKKEIELEYDFSFPIYKYLNNVTPSDIFVSDMYLSSETIKNMINKHKDISLNFLHVSSGDKSSGRFWKENPISRRIRTHYGDNIRSDYINARSNGVNAILINNVELTNTEKIIESILPNISYIIRAVRLTLQNEDPFTIYATEIMLPIGVLICYYIHEYKTLKNIEEIIFLSRDCYWLKMIYDTMYPIDNTYYEYFSRLYISEITNRNKIISRLENGKKNLVIDLVGSGSTFNYNIGPFLTNTHYLLFLQHTPLRRYIASFHTILTPEFYRKGFKIIEFVEDVFSAPHGSINNNGEILDSEYDITILKQHMNTIKLFKEYSDIYIKYNINPVVPNIPVDTLLNKIINLMENVSLIDFNGIREKIKHVNNHSDEYIHYPLKFYSQIGQDEYFIKNISKFMSNGIFLDIGGYDGITGSNTYFLEKYLNWKGIIVECNPKIAKICAANRSSPVIDKAIYHVSDSIVNFRIPLGSEIIGGKEQLAGIEDAMRPESLRYFSNSFKESEIIKIPTITINDIIQKYNLHTIDYMSLDIEGYELHALKSIDYTKVKILYMTVEHACVDTIIKEMREFMKSVGYEHVRGNKWDDEYKLISK
jgi:FkbM family methyltransferase